MGFSAQIFGPNTGRSMKARQGGASRTLASQGRYGDTDVIHASPATRNLLKALGGAGTINPSTGMPEFYTGNPGATNPWGGEGEAAHTNAGSSASSTGATAPAMDHFDTINNAYMDIFGREVGDAGLNFYGEHMSAGNIDEDALRADLAKSNEAQLRNTYRNELGRNGDQEGVNWWSDQVNSGNVTMDEAQRMISTSAEAKGSTPWVDYDNNGLPDDQAGMVKYGFAPSGAVKDYFGISDPVQEQPAENPEMDPLVEEMAALRAQLASATGTNQSQTDGMTMDQVKAAIQEAMGQNNTGAYDPMAFMNAFGFSANPSYFGDLISTFQNPSGAYVRKMVKDRETGEMRYINVPVSAAAAAGNGSFRQERRNGFGSLI